MSNLSWSWWKTNCHISIHFKAIWQNNLILKLEYCLVRLYMTRKKTDFFRKFTRATLDYTRLNPPNGWSLLSTENGSGCLTEYRFSDRPSNSIKTLNPYISSNFPQAQHHKYYEIKCQTLFSFFRKYSILFLRKKLWSFLGMESFS